jgi:hypothetical protein
MVEGQKGRARSSGKVQAWVKAREQVKREQEQREGVRNLGYKAGARGKGRDGGKGKGKGKQRRARGALTIFITHSGFCPIPLGTSNIRLVVDFVGGDPDLTSGGAVLRGTCQAASAGGALEQ